MTGTHTTSHTSYLTRTCLRWTSEGELEQDDLHQVLTRLAAVDGYSPDLWPPDGAGSTPSA